MLNGWGFLGELKRVTSAGNGANIELWLDESQDKSLVEERSRGNKFANVLFPNLESVDADTIFIARMKTEDVGATCLVVVPASVLAKYQRNVNDLPSASTAPSH